MVVPPGERTLGSPEPSQLGAQEGKWLRRACNTSACSHMAVTSGPGSQEQVEQVRKGGQLPGARPGGERKEQAEDSQGRVQVLATAGLGAECTQVLRDLRAQHGHKDDMRSLRE